ncbi:TatD family hydrolase [Ferrimonas lipolytica]|uniref:Hydrolase TatD n=1 Tax=Ferrimonas lipolytica TaxID=2724191 RepID=A0A6H1UG10_9GAMM|nr:TatD family hydrolase [Ferrimonas lipolytica]QIZ77984.1 hydrolase TatD [Ferrimonas lipolytica]
MQPLTDIAVNLSSSQFKGDIDVVVARAATAGVTSLLNLSSTVAEAQQGLELSQRYPQVFSTAGVHPHNASEWNQHSGATLRSLLSAPKMVAVGECGLDYNRDFSPRPAQRAAFAEQLQLAVELNLPVLMHCREAYQDFVPLVAAVRPQLPAAILHCFTGSAEELGQALELDCYIGITGWICDERRGTLLRQLVKTIPDNRLLLETDAPYLLPRDLRPKPKSRRNEPAYLPHIAQTVAQLRGQSVDTVSQLCQQNAAAALIPAHLLINT